jgi:DNA replication initiation complex subunit (GINS family)
MDGESQERIYLSLYRVWQEAHKSQILSEIPNQESFIEQIQSLIQVLKTQLSETKQAPLSLIYQKTLANLRYMAQDLLRLRKAKILNLTQGHQKIDETTLFLFEQAYYRQLYTAFKGYTVSKKGFVQSIENNGFNGHNSHPPASPPTKLTKSPSPSFTENASKTESLISPTLPRDEDQIEPSATSPQPVLSEEQQRNPARPAISTQMDPSKVTYNLFRVNKSSDALVGADLRIYGPLKTEDLVFLPEKNARMLIEEKIVHQIKFIPQ